jgi:hypothetical protein
VVPDGGRVYEQVSPVVVSSSNFQYTYIEALKIELPHVPSRC